MWIWEVSGVAQNCFRPLLRVCVDYHSCFSAQLLHCHFTIGFPCLFIYLVQSLMTFPDGSLFSESVGLFSLASNCFLAQSLNVLILKSQKREFYWTRFVQLSNPGPVHCEWWFDLYQGLDRVSFLRCVVEEIILGISNILDFLQTH